MKTLRETQIDTLVDLAGKIRTPLSVFYFAKEEKQFIKIITKEDESVIIPVFKVLSILKTLCYNGLIEEVEMKNKTLYKIQGINGKDFFVELKKIELVLEKKDEIIARLLKENYKNKL